jgi:hypothetical protein
MESKETYDYKESLLPPEEQTELNKLRMTLFERKLTEEEEGRFLELSEKEQGEKNRRSRKPGLTEEEKREWLQLTREQTESINWTLEKAERLLKLQKKM